MASAGGEQPIIIKKKKVSGHGHHGGAWKVAYADFVTAMMASFNGAPPQLAVEFGRKVLYHSVRPTWTEVEERVKQKPA